MNALGREKVRATFFVVGKQVDQNPALARRMMNEGHEVGNHSYNHARLEGMSADRIRAEIASCDKAVMRATGARCSLFRPPGMRYDDVVINAAQELNYVTIHWNTAAKDFDGGDRREVAARVIRNTRPGSVILLHGHPDTIEALPEIIQTLRVRGYRFVTITQMLARLPRPVYVKSNAYAATTPEPTLIEPRAAVTRIARSRPKSASHLKPPAKAAPVPATAVRGTDVPAWN